MTTDTAFVLTLMVLCYAVVSGLVKRWYLAPALIFVLLGMMLGPFGFNVLEGGPATSTFTILAQLALTVILFNQAAELDLSAVVDRREVTFRLLVIGIPLAIALGVVTALLLFPVMPVWEAVCLAAIVAPTEVALVDALMENDRVPERIRHALSTESGFYDGFALAALLAALALASERSGSGVNWGWFLVRTEVVSTIVGLVLGAAGGWVIGKARERGWMSDTWAQLATLAVALVCFQVAEMGHGSGFVAAFAGGLAFAYAARKVGSRPETHVSDAAGQLLELTVFAMFGGYAVIVGWRQASWRVVVFAVMALFVVRLIAVLLALLRSALPMRERLFIGWFGPRGIGTLVLGLLVVERGQIQQESLIIEVVGVTVSLSLLLHSLSAWPGIKWLGAAEDPVAEPDDRPDSAEPEELRSDVDPEAVSEPRVRGVLD